MRYSDLTDEDLIAKASAGDNRAFDVLMRRHQENLRRQILFFFKGDEHSANDALQWALIRVHRYLKNFKGDSKFSTWLYSVAKVACLDVANERSGKMTTVSLDEIENSMLGSDNPEDIVSARQQAALISKTLDTLHPVIAETFVLREMEGLTGEEVSKQLGCPLGTVRSRINRARSAFQDALQIKLPADSVMVESSAYTEVEAAEPCAADEDRSINMPQRINQLGWTEYTDGQGRLHREDGPALIKPNGSQEWYLHGVPHREDGPACEYATMQMWMQNGQMHREDGPALVGEGREEYWVNGKLHREDGPALVSPSLIEYRRRGRLHREDGPARIIPGVKEEWYVADILHNALGPAVKYANGQEEWYIAGDKLGK